MTESAPRTLLPRQEAFCRHVAAGRPLAVAARLAGYAWVGAKQQGSRMMRDPRISARVLELSAKREAQRLAEIDMLVSTARVVFDEAMYRDSFGAAIRALNMISRLRGLEGEATAMALTAGDDQADEDEEEEAVAPPEAEAEPEAEADEPAACMPPEAPTPLEPVIAKPRMPCALNPAPAKAPGQDASSLEVQDMASAAFEKDFARLPPNMAQAARKIVAPDLTNADLR